VSFKNLHLSFEKYFKNQNRPRFFSSYVFVIKQKVVIFWNDPAKGGNNEYLTVPYGDRLLLQKDMLMWSLEHPWWEYIVRSLAIYAVVFVLLRIFGKKQLGEMSPFDFVLLLILSESISAGITGNDGSLAAAFICVSTFIFTNRFLDILSFKFKGVEKILEGEAHEIINDGQVNASLCRKEYISKEELESSLRENGHYELKKVKKAILETNGKISVIDSDNNQPTL
jgi:hypothetical protein